MKASAGQIICFDNEGFPLFGCVTSILDGIKPHAIVDTCLGCAYVSDSKILQVYPEVQVGHTVGVTINGVSTRWTVLGMRLNRATVILFCQCVISNEIKPFPIQGVRFV